MNLIIVTTDWGKKIWEKLTEDLIGERVKHFEFKVDDGVFNEITANELRSISRIDFASDKENRLILIRQNNEDDNTKKVSKVIAEQCESNRDCEIYLAMHRNGGQVDIHRLQMPTNCRLSHCEFIHEQKDEVYKRLVCFVLNFFGKDQQIWQELGFGADFNFCQIDSKSAFNNLIEIIKKKPVISNFSILKHRIAHLFLAMDIDFQGIAEIRSQGAVDRAVDYFRQVLKDKSPGYSKQKLAALQYMVARVNKVNNKELLADEKAIIDLIDEEKRGNENVKKCWEELLEICGLEFNNHDPFSNIKVNNRSPIYQFMEKLDGFLAAPQNKITAESVDEILNYDEGQIWFHQWVVRLDQALQDLRAALDGNGK